MGKPAARMGDTTIHGGKIISGFPQVLIGKLPAARVGDMHVCPMLNPGTPPPPHVGMAILPPGVPTVLIGGQPAATVGDMVACAGPPDTIAPPGCPTVLIGAGGGAGAGGGGGGASGGSGSAATVSSSGEGGGAGTAETGSGPTEEAEEESYYLHVDFVDAGGFPVAGLGYKLKTPDGNESTGTLSGTIAADLEQPGDSEIKLIGLARVAWSEEKVKIGNEVKLQVETIGIESGAETKLEILTRGRQGSPTSVAKFDSRVQNGKIEETWTAEISDELVEEQRRTAEEGGFLSPFYYFTVYVEGFSTRSGLLLITDDVKIKLLDEEDQPVLDGEYQMRLSNGEVRSGTLDSSGMAEEKDVPAGVTLLKFTRIPLEDE